MDFVHCQGIEPEDFRSPGGPFSHFQEKKSCQVTTLRKFLLQPVVFSREYVRFTVNKLFQRSTVHYTI